MAGKTCNILVTGANRGLGLEFIKQLAEKPCPGRRIFAGCRDPSKAEGLEKLSKKHPGVIHIIRLDVGDSASVLEAAKQVSSIVGGDGLNLLVNNAGMAYHSNMKEAVPSEMENTFNVNVMGPMRMTKEFLPLLQAAAKKSSESGMSCRRAAVINISTLLGCIEKVPATYGFFPVLALPYRVSKAGLNMMTVCNAEEFKGDRILFTLLHPGWVRTDMGGPDGEIEAAESVSGMLSVMETLTEKHNGAFLDYKGQPLSW
ncbi:C-signal-like [Engraulis encrasicolus]|uniref:C-signal-like n=1 Tax=Engraulis encrasicolus TaxID=184585 RepID=UPI002FD1DB37